MTFTENVLSIVKNIPRGTTMSYKQVAERAGNPKAARVVGTIMKKNYRSDIPCHRVIKSDGTPGKYNRGDLQKISILRREGAID